MMRMYFVFIEKIHDVILCLVLSSRLVYSIASPMDVYAIYPPPACATITF